MKEIAMIVMNIPVGIVNSIVGKYTLLFSKPKLNRRNADEKRKIIRIGKAKYEIFNFPNKSKNKKNIKMLNAYEGKFVLPNIFEITGCKNETEQKYKKRTETVDEIMQLIIFRLFLFIFFSNSLM